MGAIRPPKRAALFCGLLSGDPDLIALGRTRLAEVLGPIEQVSPVWPFDCTDYYRQELGDEVKRQFVLFEQLVTVDRLPEIKRQTNDVERRIAEDLALPAPARPVNLDPGYLTLSKLVLASTKDYSHRIYVQSGVYAEVTLRYEDGAWRSWPWTYPDYAAPTYHGFFDQAREAYRRKLGQER